MTSPLSGATLTAQRATQRWKKYYCAIVTPNSIFTARINQTFDTLDGITELSYDGGTGTYTDVKAGMTCWIGSSAGASDIGIVRVTKALSATKAYIGKVSGIQFADNQYLTFVDDFGLWAREPKSTDTSVLIDEDVTWTAAMAGSPIVRIGPPAIVLQMTGATVSVTWIAPAIYSPTGATAASYAWTAPSASATSNMTTATPTITYNAAGVYTVYCALTDSGGVTTTVTRKVLVNPTSVPVSVSSLTGDVDSGSWSAHIEGYSGVDIATLHDRSMVVLWKVDYVGAATDTQYGPYTNGENVRLIGWVDGESITQNPDYGTFEFDLHGIGYWLDRIPGYPLTITDTTAADWNTIATLDIDKTLHRLIKWQSTLSYITDVTLTGDTTRIKTANINTGSLRQQIDGLAGEKILARMVSDRYSCVYVSLPPSLQDSTGKAALTVLWDTTSADWGSDIRIERVTSTQAAMMEIGGNGYDGTNETAYWSRAPGNSPAHYGAMQSPSTTLALGSQTIANRLSGDMLADQNIEYPAVDVTLYWANDYVDIAPGYIVRVSLAAGDTPRGITWTTKRFCVLAVTYNYNPETGAEYTTLTLAEETTGYPGVTYYPPSPVQISPPPLPLTPSLRIPGIGTWVPPVGTTIPPVSACATAGSNYFPIIFSPGTLADGESAKAYAPCILRPSSYAHGPSSILLNLGLEQIMDTIECYAIDASGNRLLSGVVSLMSEASAWGNSTVTFYPTAELSVAGFEIVAHCYGKITTTPLTINAVTPPNIVVTANFGDTVTTDQFDVTQATDGIIRCDFAFTIAWTSVFTSAAWAHIYLRTVNSTAGSNLYGVVSHFGYPAGTYMDSDPDAATKHESDYWTSTLTWVTSAAASGAYAFGLESFAGNVYGAGHGTYHTSGRIFVWAGSGTPTATHIKISNPATLRDVC